jgi:hypothetical protein
MKKLSLNVEELRVESFSTAGGARRRGTVRANEASFDVECQPTWVPNSCDAYYTVLDGCGGGGGNTGLNTCGDGDNCTAGYTEWNTCTNNYKLCG